MRSVVPFLDLKAQYASVKEEIEPAVLAVLASAGYILGPEVAAFEREFAGYCGATEGIAMNSGTSALHAALLAAGVGPGDEVITTPFTFVATVSAICSAGATPTFVDIDPVSLTMDPARLAAALTPRTRAIIPVHLYGQPCDMDPIIAFAREHGLMIIEDACQAHGARYKDRPVGSIGELACFSFYPGKNLGACGEGGIVVTSDPARAKLARMYRDWGQEQKYNHVLQGFNYRMDGVQGAILRVKLRHLEAWTEARRTNARRYDALLDAAGIKRPQEMSYSRHVYHVYAIRVADRAAVQAALRAQDIESGIHYPIPVHMQPAYAFLGYREGNFPHAEAAAREVLSLPMFPELTAEQQARVVTALAAQPEAALSCSQNAS
jgi:dTDP-4-amino-4,6-dideoxygalactose transaminase